jgi:hypothetical protein
MYRMEKLFVKVVAALYERRARLDSARLDSERLDSAVADRRYNGTGLFFCGRRLRPVAALYERRNRLESAVTDRRYRCSVTSRCRHAIIAL